MDPVSGILTRDELRALAAQPGFGEARKAIRRRDPMWGVAVGETIEWRVSMSRDSRDEGYVIVRAASAEEAERLAGDVKEADIVYVDTAPIGDWEIEDAVPVVK